MTEDKKWIPCSSGKHLWPWPLEESAKRCCGDYAISSLDYDPKAPENYFCCSGKHAWPHKEEAALCCNGYVPVWKTIGKPGTKENPFEWRELQLEPVATVIDIDEKSSAPHDKKHLGKLM